MNNTINTQPRNLQTSRLEEVADAILQTERDAGSDVRIYTDAELSRRMRREYRRLPVVQEERVPEGMVDYLVADRIGELIELARLRPMEEICLGMCIDGFSVRQSAMILGVGRRRVEMHLRAARRKVQQVYDEGPYAGWQEVYLSEISRRKK